MYKTFEKKVTRKHVEDFRKTIISNFYNYIIFLKPRTNRESLLRKDWNLQHLIALSLYLLQLMKSDDLRQGRLVRW